MVFSLDPGMPGDLILPIILSKHMTSSCAQSMSVFHPREHSWRSRLSITGAKLLCYVLVRDCHSGKRMKLLNVSKGPLNWDTIARGAVLRDCHLSLPRASQVCSNLQTLEMALKPRETSAQLCPRLAVCPEVSSEAGDSVGLFQTLYQNQCHSKESLGLWSSCTCNIDVHTILCNSIMSK